MCHPEAGDGRLALPAGADEVEIPVAEGVLPALLVRPQGEPVGNVLIFHDVFGRTAFYEELAARLAGAGYRAVLPDFFHHEGALEENTVEAALQRRQRADSRGMLSEGRAAAGWIGDGIATRLGVIGFFIGGHFAFGLAGGGGRPPPASLVRF